MSFRKLLSVIFILVCFAGAKLIAQDNAPPKPLDNKVYESMVGDWTGESPMMGMPTVQEVSITWNLNHQYIFMNLTATGKDNPKISYHGLGIFGVDEKGNAKLWWFDDWGAAMTSTGSGTFSGNKLEITDGNEMFKETRSFEVNGNEMTMKAKGSMKMNGQDIPFEETTVFKKK
jgi:hypothetical protein